MARRRRCGARQRERSVACWAAAALLLLLAGPCSGLKAVVHPHQTECFTEYIGQEHFNDVQGARVEGAFFVTGRHPNHTPSMTLNLYAPSGQVMWAQSHVEAEAHFNVAAHGPGSYRICFDNHVGADVTVDLVYFHLGHIRRPGQVQVPTGTDKSRGKEMARKEHLDDVKQATVIVNELVDILSGEQKYLHRKLERHMQTCRSNNRRTLWYTMLEVLVLAGMGACNCAVISRMFAGAGGGMPRYARIAV